MQSPDSIAFPQQTAKFYALASRLKRLERAGWRRCGVGAGDCESVADHSFFVALLLPRFARDEKHDRFRCVALALVHDERSGGLTPDQASAFRDSAAGRVTSEVGKDLLNADFSTGIADS